MCRIKILCAKNAGGLMHEGGGGGVFVGHYGTSK